MTELLNFIRTYDGALEPQLCDHLVEAFENWRQFQIRNGKVAREGLSESSWTELDLTKRSDRQFKAALTDRIFEYKAKYESDCGISPPLPDPAAFGRLMMKRYTPNHQDWFQPHYDSVGEHANRYLVFLWYLNDVDEGGETEFVDLDCSIQAAKGRLLMFPPYWMWRHAGNPPVSNAKYIVSTYLLR